MNKVFLIGRLTRDPELRYTSSNIATASFSIAVDRNFTNQNGEREADFINIVVWRKQAENVKNYLTKGSQVAIDGRIQTRSYDGQDGQKRYVTEVVADNVQFLGTRANNNGGESSYNQSNYAQPAFNDNATPYDFAQTPAQSQPTTDVSNDPFADFGSSIEISDDELPF
jgi:single-strand DNA-binding protein